MKADEVEIGKTYHIHTGRLGITRIKVTSIYVPRSRMKAKHREEDGYFRSYGQSWRFHGTNLKTGRDITLKVATHFVGEHLDVDCPHCG